MKKITDILSGVLAFGIMIGLLAVPIYFLRWYEVIAIHFLCFLISFILSKVITTRKFKDPQNVFIATLLFGMAGLFLNLFEWKKSVNDEVEKIKNKLKHSDESPEFIEFGKNISEGKNHLAIEIFCKNTGLFYCSEKNVSNEFGSPLTEDEIREFLKDKTSEKKLSEILEYRFNIYKGNWESSGYAYFTTKHAVAKIKEYLVQSKKVSLEEFESWFLKNYRQDDSYNDPKDIVTFYEEGYHLSYSSKKDQVKITPLFIYNTLYKECNLFWNSLREIRKDYSEPINPEFNDRVLKPLLHIWENESKEMYFKKSFKIWKKFLFPNETDDNDCGSIEIYGEGSAFLGSNDEVLFNGIKMDLHWLFDEEDGDYEASGYNLAMSWNGLVANLPKYYDFDFTNGSGEFGTGIGLDGVCKILSELPIIDYNKLSEEEKEDISYIKFPHKDDVIEEKEGEVQLNTDLPDNWGNDSSKKDDEKGELNLNLNEKSKIELTSNYPQQEVPLSEFIDVNGIDETLRKIQNDEKELVVSLKISNRNGLLSCKCKSNDLEVLDAKRVAEYLSEYSIDNSQFNSIDKFPNNFKVINPLFWDSFGKAIASKVNSIDILNELVENESDYEDIDELIQEYIVNDCSHNYAGEFFKQENWEILETSTFCDYCVDFDVISNGMVEGIEHETTIRNKANTQTKVENESLQESPKAERVKSFCTNCGESISAGDKFCGSCGTKTN